MRKGIKVLAVIAAVATASMMSVPAFALEYATTTTYNTETGKADVVTNVTGAAPGEQVAYLVYEGATPTDSTIKYIDQKPADSSGAAQFSFSADKAIKAMSYVGTTSTASSLNNVKTGGTAEVGVDCVVTYTTDGNGFVTVAADDAELVDGGSATSKNEIVFVVAPKAGYKLVGYTEDGGAVTNVTMTGDGTTYTYSVPAGKTEVALKFIFDEDNTALEVKLDSVTKEENTLTAVAKVTGATGAGIVVGANLDALEKGEYESYEALAVGSDGIFAIVLTETVDEGASAFITTSTAVKAYAKTDEGYTFSGAQVAQEAK